MSDKPVLVEVLEAHTYDGIPRALGTTYEAEAGTVEFLTLRGWARPVPPAPDPAPKATARKK